MKTCTSDEPQAAKPQQFDQLLESKLGWLAQRPPYTWRLIAVSLLTLLSVVALFQASLVVDGARYFWLDDDQMISMRYARNLVEGYGLVWNAGERVEGYTNFLWTLVMAGAHLLAVGDAKTAVVVKTVNWALAVATLFLSERLLRVFQPKPGLALPALLVTLALCMDLVYWSVNGFETTLLTAAFLLVIVRILKESEAWRPRFSTYVLMGLLPLIRSDAYHMWAAAALLALSISHDRRHTVWLLGVSLVLPGLHLLFRRWYYGDWLPNTYYLKVVGLSGRTVLGLRYLGRFLKNYGVAFALAFIGALAAGDRRRGLLVAGLAISGCYVVVVGGDWFSNSRLLAHFVPVVLVLSLASISEAIRKGAMAQLLLVLALCLSVFFQAGAYEPRLLQDGNGNPEPGLVAGLLIRRFTRPEAKVAVIAAGNVPYFSRRHAIDLLGRSDPHVARLQPCSGGSVVPSIIGHNKFDPSYSLGLNPDLVVTLSPHNVVLSDLVLEPWCKRGCQWAAAVLCDLGFRRDYRPNPVNVPYLLDHASTYIRSSSAELSTMNLWKEPRILK